MLSQQDRLFLAAAAFYFAAQATLRTGLGGALEVDEAEMVLLARDWRLGYGPQLPLYNWLQVASFQTFGIGTAALAIPKNAVLFLAVAGLFLGLRRVTAFGPAMAGALSIAFLPNVLWEFQRASTHSIALLAAVTWTIGLTLAALAGDRRRDWIAVGIAMGLGGLSKFNFWLVPAALFIAALWPAVPRPRIGNLALAVLTAALIVVLPYAWVFANPDQSLASTRKMYVADTGLPAGIEGLGEALLGTLAGLLLVGVAAVLLARARKGAVPPESAWAGPLMVRAGLTALAASFAAIVLGGVSEVESRWLVPAYVLIGAGLFAGLTAGAPAKVTNRLAMAAAGLCLVTFAGMAELRAVGRATGRIDFAPLAALTDRLQPDLVLSPYFVGGNLAMLRPGLDVRTPPLAPETPAGTRILNLVRDHEAVEGKVTEAGTLSLPYMTGATPPVDVIWRLMETR